MLVILHLHHSAHSWLLLLLTFLEHEWIGKGVFFEQEVECLVRKFFPQFQVCCILWAVKLERLCIGQVHIAKFARNFLLRACALWGSRKIPWRASSILEISCLLEVELVLKLEGSNVARLPKTTIPAFIYTPREEQLHLRDVSDVIFLAFYNTKNMLVSAFTEGKIARVFGFCGQALGSL